MKIHFFKVKVINFTNWCFRDIQETVTEMPAETLHLEAKTNASARWLLNLHVGHIVISD